MAEEDLREVLGIAKKSKWNQIKKFIKFIIQNTLKKDAGYSLTALDVSVNGKKRPKYNLLIKNKGKINDIDKIIDFNHLSLYQATHNSNNLIEISQNNGTITVLAKYLGPSLNNHQIFDFSVHLDALTEPFFTIGNGIKISSTEILKFINKSTELIPKTKKETIKKESKQVKDTKIQNIEVFAFEKLTDKNAIWNGTETKTFQNWKAKTKNKYRIESGNIAYYKGKPTKKFSQYLENLHKNINNKTKKETTKKVSKQVKDTKIQNIEVFAFEKLTDKNAIWNGTETKTFQNWKAKTKNKYRIESGNIAYYKGKPTKKFSQYLENLYKNINNKTKKPKKKLDKKIISSKKDDKEVSEHFIFKTLTGKNAIWNGSETQKFNNWKPRIHKKYKKETGKNPYYGEKLTQNFKNYLKTLI